MKISFNKTEKKLVSCFILVIILSVLIIPYTKFGSTTIGSLIEKREYTEYYYAYLFDNFDSSMSNRVKIKIYSHIAELDNISQRVYIVEEVYSDKNNLIYKDDSWTTEVELNKKRYIELDSGKQCYIELTNKKYP